LLGILWLGGLLLASPPAWAVTRSAKRPAKSPADTASSTGTTCTTGTCSSTDSTPTTDVDNKLGTTVTWMPTPDAAARSAADQDKLVFMIQVSGNFARQEFT